MKTVLTPRRERRGLKEGPSMKKIALSGIVLSLLLSACSTSATEPKSLPETEAPPAATPTALPPTATSRPMPTPVPVAEPGLVDVGGFRLFMTCEGQGAPTVLIEPGQFDDIGYWKPVLAETAKLTQVCYYDRAGVGRSDPGPTPRTSQTNVDELYTLITKTGLNTPLVMVAASFGGFDARLFASQHPEMLAGMVLVDVEHPDQRQRLDGLLPADFVWAEFEGVDWEQSAAQVRATGSLGDLPLVVLTAATHLFTDGQAEWEAMQRELAGLSSAGTNVVVQGSGHHINEDQPSAVVEAIHNVVESVRTNSQ